MEKSYDIVKDIIETSFTVKVVKVVKKKVMEREEKSNLIIF